MSSRILVVDDNPSDLFLITQTLTLSDMTCSIVQAKTAQEALDLIAEPAPFDFIFLDYLLPDMDGIGVLKRIYDEQSDLGPCPVIILTGQGSEAVAIDAIRYGAQDYLMKGHITKDTLDIAMARSKEIFDLKRDHNEAKAFLEHSQKMDAIGRLTGGIAHDFNNLLTITYGNAELLQDLMQMPDVDMDMCLKRVEVIQSATERGADLVKRLMLFARQRTLEPVTVELNDVLDELIVLLGRTLGDFVEIKGCYGIDIHPIHVDPSQLEHAVINMGVNARDAMKNGGVLSLETANVRVEGDEAQALSLDEGDYVRLSVKDTGSGIPKEVLPKIFEPFFTTKDIGHGTGLGLSMVYRFIVDSGGALDVETDSVVGTSFHLYFPSAGEAVHVSSREVKEQRTDIQGSETILVVEDEQEIRFLTCMMLREVGYNIIEAENGHDALRVIQETDQAIDLIFTDISMPGDMNGVQMAGRAQVLLPGVKLLFTTGYAADAMPDMNLTKDYPILHKPYQPRDLYIKIRDVIDA